MFLTGLAVVLPLILTAGVVVVVGHYMGKAGKPLLQFLAFWLNVFTSRRGEENAFVPEDFNLLVQILLPVIVIIMLGIMARNVIGSKIVSWVDSLVHGIPFVNFIYRVLKQAIESVRNIGNTDGFKRVVYIEYPAPGCRLIGFVTGQFFDEETGKDVTAVFLPTSPNPMTGFVVIVENDKLTNTDMSLEDATKLVLSAGLVAPGGITNENGGTKLSGKVGDNT